MLNKLLTFDWFKFKVRQSKNLSPLPCFIADLLEESPDVNDWDQKGEVKLFTS